jgi:hypothetical protein
MSEPIWGDEEDIFGDNPEVEIVLSRELTPLLFLDVDGVLNSHDANEYHFNTIHRDKIERLNRIVKATGAEIVISSAWRYMILGGSMTIDGFRYLLQTSRSRAVRKDRWAHEV